MNLREYVATKYGDTGWCLLACEAKALGIPYPLQKGWLERYGNLLIEGELWKRLGAALLASKRRSSAAGLIALGLEPSPKQAFRMNVAASMKALKKEKREASLEHHKAYRAKLREERKAAKVALLAAQPTKPTKVKASAGKCYVRGLDVASTEFLETYEWRQLRMQVLRHYGARCMCCGASPSTGAVMNVDHIKPRKLFPHLALEFDNLQVLCGDCNHGKGNWDQTDWREPPLDADQAEHLRSIASGY